jgi:hypothetical protein
MLNLQFNLRNPFSSRWKCLYTKFGNLPIKHKHWEIQIDKCADIVGFEFRFTTRQDHAGFYLSLSLLGYDIIFTAYDSRHWNDEQNRYVNYDDPAEMHELYPENYL